MTILDRSAAGLPMSKLDSSRVSKVKHRLTRLEETQRSRREMLDRIEWVDSSAELMCLAATAGDAERVAELIRAGASVNEVDSKGFLPLLYACREGHVEVARLLLEAGSDCTSYLSGHSALEKAAASNDCSIVELLLSHGASVDDAGLGGRPPLVTAAATGALDTLEVLLDTGADVNCGDLLGNTALHVAVTELPPQDPSAIIRTLLLRGADKLRPNLAGETPVQLSLRSLNMLTIEAIGARVNKIS